MVMVRIENTNPMSMRQLAITTFTLTIQENILLEAQQAQQAQQEPQELMVQQGLMELTVQQALMELTVLEDVLPHNLAREEPEKEAVQVVEAV